MYPAFLPWRVHILIHFTIIWRWWARQQLTCVDDVLDSLGASVISVATVWTKETGSLATRDSQSRDKAVIKQIIQNSQIILCANISKQAKSIRLFSTKWESIFILLFFSGIYNLKPNVRGQSKSLDIKFCLAELLVLTCESPTFSNFNNLPYFF